MHAAVILDGSNIRQGKWLFAMVCGVQSVYRKLLEQGKRFYTKGDRNALNIVYRHILLAAF